MLAFHVRLVVDDQLAVIHQKRRALEGAAVLKKCEVCEVVLLDVVVGLVGDPVGLERQAVAAGDLLSQLQELDLFPRFAPLILRRLRDGIGPQGDDAGLGDDALDEHFARLGSAVLDGDCVALLGVPRVPQLAGVVELEQQLVALLFGVHIVIAAVDADVRVDVGAFV